MIQYTIGNTKSPYFFSRLSKKFVMFRHMVLGYCYRYYYCYYFIAKSRISPNTPSRTGLIHMCVCVSVCVFIILYNNYSLSRIYHYTMCKMCDWTGQRSRSRPKPQRRRWRNGVTFRREQGSRWHGAVVVEARRQPGRGQIRQESDQRRGGKPPDGGERDVLILWRYI